MRKHLSKNKAITFDGFTESWFLKSERYDLLCDLWRGDCLSLMTQVGESRLIPLNKVYPSIPKMEEFRPIVVLSIMYKWLELRFLYKLNRYMVNKMDPNQTGFV